MTAEPMLVCGSDLKRLYYLERAFEASGEAHVYQGRGPGRDGPKVTLRVWKPFGDRPEERQFEAWRTGVEILAGLGGVEGVCRGLDDFTGPRPWREGQTPSSEPVPIQVLAYVEGENLQQRLRPGSRMARRDGPLDGAHVLHGLARVLGELARRGIVHRDIDPSNLIVADDGRIVLIDFSTARYEETRTQAIGKKGYMAPETGELTTARDVHGFGGVAFFLLFGNSPVLGDHEVLDDVRMPARLRQHLELVLARDPAGRLPAAKLPGWVDELAWIVGETGHRAPGVTWPDDTAPPAVDPWGAPAPAPNPASAPARAPASPPASVPDEMSEGWCTLEELRRLVTAAPVVPPPRSAPPGTRPILLLPAPSPVVPVVPVGRAPAETRPAGVASVPAPRSESDTLIGLPAGVEIWDADPETAAEVQERPWRRWLFGSEYVVVPALAAVPAWLLWLAGSHKLADVEAWGSLVLVALAAVVAALLSLWTGAATLRWRPELAGEIWFWRLLHVPAGSVFTVAILGYAILMG